jgi:tetratricopeptide (TPR) repeat protein
MNKRRHVLYWIVSFLFLQMTGCFGGKAPVVRTENQQRSESALTRAVRAEQRGNYPDAEKFLSEALALSTSIEDNPVRINALINLARLNRLQHSLTKATGYIDQALTLVKTESLFAAEVSYEKSLLELAGGNTARALDWAQQSLAAEHGREQGARRNLIGRIQMLLGNNTIAESLARTAREENRAAGQVEEEANSLRILGIIAGREQKYTEGERLLEEALALDKRIGKSGKIAADLEELAITALAAGRLDDSANYQERAYEINFAAGRFQQALSNLEALADTYSKQGDSTRADRAMDTARKLSTGIKSHEPQKSSETISPSSKP